MNLLGSKKGQIQNYLAVIIVLFLFGFLSMLSLFMVYELTEGYQDAGMYVGKLKEAGEGFKAGMRVLDYAIVILMAVLIVGIGITSYRLNTAPIFFIVTLILGVFLGAVSYFFSYLFQQIISEGTFGTILVLFPRTLVICTNLHWVSLAAVAVGSITLYAKRPAQFGGLP